MACMTFNPIFNETSLARYEIENGASYAIYRDMKLKMARVMPSIDVRNRCTSKM